MERRKRRGKPRAVGNDRRSGHAAVPLLERPEKSARDRHDTGGPAAHPPLALVEPGELRRGSPRLGRVQPGMLFRENSGDGVGLIDYGQRRKARSQIREHEIAREESVPSPAGAKEERGRGRQVAPFSERRRDPPQAEPRMRIESEERKAGLVAPAVRPANHELDLDPAASERMRGLDGLDAVRSLHGEPDVGEVEDLHEGSADARTS